VIWPAGEDQRLTDQRVQDDPVRRLASHRDGRRQRPVRGGQCSRADDRLIAVATMLTGALFGAVFVRHAPICYPPAIALVMIILGAVPSHILGKPDSAWSTPGLARPPGREKREMKT
jgi:hypothetical protein